MRLNIQTPARLHFGLLEICKDQPHRFGGVGLMIESHGFHVECDTQRPHCTGSSDQASDYSQRIQDAIERHRIVHLGSGSTGSFKVHQAPKPHCGLGSGTQLACAIATLLRSRNSNFFEDKDALKTGSTLAIKLWEQASESTPELALQRATGRGERSHIGLSGFLRGGWIYDSGHVGKQVAPTTSITSVSQWPILLATPRVQNNVHGAKEIEYFRACESVPNANIARMLELIKKAIVPSLETGDWDSLGPALYEYGRMAGRVFDKVQFGDFRSQEVFQLTELIRSLGVPGAGQSSWGPTVFGICRDRDQAKFVLEKLSSHELVESVSITKIAEQGASLNWMDHVT